MNYRYLFDGIDEKIKLIDGSYVTPINFDNGATTPPLKSVTKLIQDNIKNYGPIARGVGPKGEFCTTEFAKARETILDFFNLKESNTHTVIYTKSDTESLNMLANLLVKNKDDMILTTRMEHHANDLPFRGVGKVVYIDVDNLGRINIENIEEELIKSEGKIKLVTITGASNVTGYLNPIHDIAKIVHKYNAKLIVDAAQLIAHVKVDMKGNSKDEEIDFLTFSAHKAYAPFGGGAIVGLKKYLKDATPFLSGGGCVGNSKDEEIDFLTFSAHKAYAPFGGGAIVGLKKYLKDATPFLSGGGCVAGVFDESVIWAPIPERFEAGTQNFFGVITLKKYLKDATPFLSGGGCVAGVFDESVIWAPIPERFEAGTQNFFGVITMAKALKDLKELGFHNIELHEKQIKDYLIEEMKKIDNVILYGDINNTSDRLGVITFNVKDKNYEDVAVKMANEKGISLRCGKFCAHPYVYRLLGVSGEDAYKDIVSGEQNYGMIRVSLGLYNTIEEASKFIEELKLIAKN